MTDIRFRCLIILSALLFLAVMLAGWFPPGYSDQLAQAYENEPMPWLNADGEPSVALMAVALASLVVMIAGYVGLFLFKPWGRWLSLYSSVIGLAFYPLGGAMLLSPLEALLTDASMMVWGAVLAIAYFSPVAARFRGMRAADPSRPSG